LEKLIHITEFQTPLTIVVEALDSDLEITEGFHAEILKILLAAFFSHPAIWAIVS